MSVGLLSALFASQIQETPQKGTAEDGKGRVQEGIEQMKEYRVAFYYNTDCRAEEFVKAANSVTALVLAIEQDPKTYTDWESNDDGFYIIVELKD